MSHERGHYGSQPYVGAAADADASANAFHWALSIGFGLVGLIGLNVYAKRGPRLSPHEKEVRAWEREFPGLPWYADQVKDSRQLDLWERARDHWERAR